MQSEAASATNVSRSEVKPYKVWSGDRSLRKSTTACSLKELIEKGCRKLNIPPSTQVRLVLEEDGTEVEDEDYLAFLPDNSTLMVLSPGEKWTPRGHTQEELSCHDEPDHGDTQRMSDLAALAELLRGDISRVITLSNEELQEIVSCDPSTLAHHLGETERFAASVQEGCQRHLDDRQQTTDAVDLLRLYHRSQQVSPYVDNKVEAKKRKTEEQGT